MKITILAPKTELNSELQAKLAGIGEVVYVESRSEMNMDELVEFCKDAEIIAPDPDVFGGFEVVKPKLTKLMESLPKLKAVCLSTTSYGWIDLDYCKKRGILVSNIPGYSRESVAEHVLAMILGMSKKIFVSDRRTREGRYELVMGNEIFGKTLGVIGLGSIGSRVAELGLAVGMKVIATNRSEKNQDGVEMVSLEELLQRSDVVSLNSIGRGNEGLIGTKELEMVKRGVIFVSTISREVVDEQAMAKAIGKKRVGGYCFEAEDLESGPLAELENVVMIKGFGWYTEEALAKLAEIWVENIESVVKGVGRNLVG